MGSESQSMLISVKEMSMAGDRDEAFVKAGGIDGYKIPTWKNN